MADSSTADSARASASPEGPVVAGRRPAQALRRRREHPFAGRLDEPVLRVRAPAALGVRGDTAQPRWRQPEEQEGVSSVPTRDLSGTTAGSARAATAPSSRVTLDRPDQLNAQTPATWTALAVGASLDDDVRVVVVRGRGPLLLRGPGPQPVRRRPRDRPADSASWAGCAPRRRRSASAATRPASAGSARPASSRWPRCRATPSVPARSWPWPATCGCSPTTRSCGCPRPRSAWCPT